MGLTNSQYDGIIRKYDAVRMNNARLLEERRKYVYSKIDGFKELDDSIVTTSLECAKKKMGGNESALEELHVLLSQLKDMKRNLLVGAGLSADYLDPIYNCSDCHDTGYIGQDKCHCFTKQITDILYDQSNIRDWISENNFSTLSYKYYQGEDLNRFQKAVSASHSMVDNFNSEKTSLFFYGTVGTGKSFLSGCIAHELIEKGYSCIYYSSINLFEQIAKETFRSSSKDDLYNLYDCLYNCDLLIIDDLGTETPNSFVASQLFALINERDLRKKATVISTNLSLSEIRDRYSDRVFSRIVNSFSVFHITGTDIRIQKKTGNLH